MRTRLWLGLVLVLLLAPACELVSGITFSPTPTVAKLPSPAIPSATFALPSPTLAEPPTPQRINFASGGTSATVQGVLAPNAVVRYVLNAAGGQTLIVKVTTAQGNVALSIAGADGTVFLEERAGVANFSGTLPTSQDYTIDVRATGNMPATYALEITIPPLASGVPRTPIAEPTPVRQRITFQPGAIRATIQGRTASRGMDRFAVRALGGQTMTVSVTSAANNVILIIYGADGNVLISDHAGATTWTGLLPSSQDYYIDTRSVADAAVSFTLSVTIPP